MYSLFQKAIFLTFINRIYLEHIKLLKEEEEKKKEY